MLDKSKSLGLAFDKIAKKNKNLIILSFNEKERYTYEYLNNLSNKFSYFFKKKKIYSGDTISIESTKNLYVYAMILACLKNGITYSFLDYSDNSTRKNLILKKLKPKKILFLVQKIKLKIHIIYQKKKLI